MLQSNKAEMGVREDVTRVIECAGQLESNWAPGYGTM